MATTKRRKVMPHSARVVTSTGCSHGGGDGEGLGAATEEESAPIPEMKNQHPMELLVGWQNLQNRP